MTLVPSEQKRTLEVDLLKRLRDLEPMLLWPVPFPDPWDLSITYPGQPSPDGAGGLLTPILEER